MSHASDHMHFSDKYGREWTVTRADAETIARLNRNGIKVNAKLPRRLEKSPVLIVATLWVLIQPLAEARGITPEEFGRSLTVGIINDRAVDCIIFALDAAVRGAAV